MLSGRAAAGGVAIIQIVAGIGGFLGPFLTGRVKDLTHSFSSGLYTVALLTALAALLCFAIGTPARKSPDNLAV
jgi:MFS transporter, ACS family, tartrate transporter